MCTQAYVQTFTFISTVICDYPGKSPDISCSDYAAKTWQNQAPFAWKHKCVLCHNRQVFTKTKYQVSLSLNYLSLAVTWNNKPPYKFSAPHFGNFCFQCWNHFAVVDDVLHRTFWDSVCAKYICLAILCLDQFRESFREKLPKVKHRSSLTRQTREAPGRKSHLGDIAFEKGYATLLVLCLEEKCPAGSHFGECRQSLTNARVHLPSAARILCAPKMNLSVSPQTPAVSSVSFTQRRRQPQH